MAGLRDCQINNYRTASSLTYDQEEQWGGRRAEEAEKELRALREMLCLLREYELQCVERLDVGGAKETRDRLVLLLGKEGELVRELVSLREDKENECVSQRYENQVERFDADWSAYLQRMVVQLAEGEDRLRTEQSKAREELIGRYQKEKRNFKGSVRLTEIKRKVIGLMRLHAYEQAEFESKKGGVLEREEVQLWQERVEEKLRGALALLQKKQSRQFQVLRSKNEDTLFQKLKERDGKFQILCKKNQIRCMEVRRTCRQMSKTLSAANLNRPA